MYDGSAQPYAVNAETCRLVRQLARPAGVMVEGELGRIGGNEEGVTVAPEEEDLTDPAEAERFVVETGVDALAVAVGTAHGRVLRGGTLRIDRIEAIRARVGIPLVLHGASGVPEEDMRRAIAAGIAKVNVATETNRAFLAALAQNLSEGVARNDPRAPLAAARDAAQAAIQAKLRLFGSSGRAGP
jgi:fructose-bisphosphate aldolase class II